MNSANPTKPKDVLDRIRDACRLVAERSRHVRVRADRIDAYAASLVSERLAIPPLDVDLHFVRAPAETVAYFVTLDAVNFGSGYFPYLAKRPGLSGYFTIASALADHYRAYGPIPSERLRAIDPDGCARLFGQDLRSFPIRELMRLFAEALNDLGRDLDAHYGGRFEGPIEAAGRSAARLVEILSTQRFFRDIAPYRGLDVPLYKRAQLLASDLALAFEGAGPGRFDDLDRLTIFADNVVPHVLRLDGLLEYSEPLAAAIERGELIRAGSEEETEIRACAVDCVERIGAAIARDGRPTSSRALDQLLWNRGREANYRHAKRHRTRTVFY